MRTVPYKQVLQAASVRWTGERDLANTDALLLGALIDGRAREYWESYWWPELMAWEERQFRANWLAGTTYGAATTTAGVERYYPPARKYYQSLHAGNIGNVPATLSGSDYVENSAHWAECRSSYSGDDWVTGKLYTFATGTPVIVRNPADNRYYQLTTTHTSGATLDGTKFGLLTAFVRSIALEQVDENGIALTAIGETRRVWRCNAKANPYWMRGGDEIAFEAQGDGIVVGGCQPTVWVEFRQRPSSWLWSEVWSASKAGGYAVDTYVYDATTGEVYRSTDPANTALLSDVTWVVQPFPYVLAPAVGQAAFADALRTEKDTEGYAMEAAEAERLRQVAVRLAERQQKEQMRIVQ